MHHLACMVASFPPGKHRNAIIELRGYLQYRIQSLRWNTVCVSMEDWRCLVPNHPGIGMLARVVTPLVVWDLFFSLSIKHVSGRWLHSCDALWLRIYRPWVGSLSPKSLNPVGPVYPIHVSFWIPLSSLATVNTRELEKQVTWGMLDNLMAYNNR